MRGRKEDRLRALQQQLTEGQNLTLNLKEDRCDTKGETKKARSASCSFDDTLMLSCSYVHYFYSCSLFRQKHGHLEKLHWKDCMKLTANPPECMAVPECLSAGRISFLSCTRCSPPSCISSEDRPRAQDGFLSALLQMTCGARISCSSSVVEKNAGPCHVSCCTKGSGKYCNRMLLEPDVNSGAW